MKRWLHTLDCIWTNWRRKIDKEISDFSRPTKRRKPPEHDLSGVLAAPVALCVLFVLGVISVFAWVADDDE